MQIKSTTFKIKGMNKDLSYSAFNPKFSWENKNIRLTARGGIDGNDLMGITNEKGTLLLSLNDITKDRPSMYSYTSYIDDYFLEQKYVEEIYNLNFNSYVLEESESELPEITYITTLSNYLLEQTLI